MKRYILLSLIIVGCSSNTATLGYPNASSVYSDETRAVTQFWTNDDPTTVLAFYEQTLKNWELKIKYSHDYDRGGVLLYKSDVKGLVISVGTTENGLTVTEIREGDYLNLYEEYRFLE